MQYTDFEKTVGQLNRNLSPVDDSVIEWASIASRPFVGLRDSSDIVTCVRCHNATPFPGEYNRIKCLDCGAELDLVDIKSERKAKQSFSFLFCILDHVEDIQIIRTFKMSCCLHLRNGNVSYIYKEVSRHWFSDSGECVVTALPIVMGTFVGMGKLKVRTKNRITYDYYTDIAHIYPVCRLSDTLTGSLFSVLLDIPKQGAYSFINSIFEEMKEQRVIDG